MARRLQPPVSGARLRTVPGPKMPSDASPSVRPPAGKTSASKDWLRALELTGRLDREPHRTLPRVIEEQAAERGDAPALLSESERLTFRELAERARRYSRWAAGEALARGDVVALLMPNRPEYLAIWLGLTRVGVVVALINPSLRGASLVHCLNVAQARHVIADASLAGQLADVAAELTGAPKLWLHGQAAAGWLRIDLALDAVAAEPLTPAEAPAVSLSDPALLIYTSGTTGLPKAARVSHHRLMSWSGWFSGLVDIGPGDRLYDCLPLCHSAGGVAAVGAALVGGASVVIAEKFSATRVWDDVVRWTCTLVQYIGELCRYLVAQPTHPLERAHRLRVCCGNGLSGDVWEAFQARFAVPRILEFYGATEGNFSLYNVEGKPGAIGRVPAFLAHRFPAEIVRFDPDAGAPARDTNGRCVRCGPDEAGEAIGKVASAGAARFEGYTDALASETKLLHDVFEVGDAWVRTGDLMRKDAAGFYYFVDRIGDTFRWKGENIAATEVAAALRACPGVADASVYGVAVPGASGKAGMAALVVGDDFDPATLRSRLAERLPDYARPVFLRLVADLEVTETFKLRKQTLAAEGWDPALVTDPLFVEDRAAGAYVALDAVTAAKVRRGEIRL